MQKPTPGCGAPGRRQRPWPWRNALMWAVPLKRSFRHISADFAHRRMTPRSLSACAPRRWSAQRRRRVWFWSTTGLPLPSTGSFSCFSLADRRVDEVMSMTCLPIQGGIDHYRICEQSVPKSGAGWLPVMIRGDIRSQRREH